MLYKTEEVLKLIIKILINKSKYKHIYTKVTIEINTYYAIIRKKEIANKMNVFLSCLLAIF